MILCSLTMVTLFSLRTDWNLGCSLHVLVLVSRSSSAASTDAAAARTGTTTIFEFLLQADWNLGCSLHVLVFIFAFFA